MSATLLAQLEVQGVSGDEFLEFVGAQFKNIVECKPNCRIYSKAEKPVWVLRGYYPETTVFFKLTVVGAEDCYMAYHVRARALEVKMSRKAAWAKNLSTAYNEIIFNSDSIYRNISNSMENELLGADHNIKALLPKGPGKPRVMSPKGMKLFRIKKSSTRGKRET